MGTFINRLSEIETAASKVLDGAKNRKSELDIEQQERIKAYDRTAGEEVQKELDLLQKELTASKDEQVRGLREQADTHMKQISEYFDKNHEQLAESIFQRMIRK